MELLVKKREKLGRGVKALREQGLIPAELYGRGVANIHLAVQEKDFLKVFKDAGENTVISIDLDGQRRSVLIHEVAHDVLSNRMASIDFYQVRMDEKLKVKVPVEFIGVAPAVKEKKGILIKVLQELEVEALPADLPHNIPADITKLVDIGQSIYIKDLVVPATVKVLVAPETVVATVTAQVTEEEELAAQQAATGGVESVKVETEEKKVEREAAKTATVPEGAAGAAPAVKEPAKK